MGAVCGRRVQQKDLRNHERDAYNGWKRKAVVITILMAVLSCAAYWVLYLQRHFNERYDRYKVEAERNQTIGQDLVDGICKSKPLDYHTALLDCVTARQLAALSPRDTAFSMAMDHIYYEHLSLLSLVGGCHDGICSSLLWKFGEKVLAHYHFTVTVIVVSGCLFFAIALWIYVHCHLAYREKRKVERMAQGEPQHRAKLKLFSELEDAASVRKALQLGHDDENSRLVDWDANVHKAINEYRTNTEMARKGEVAIFPGQPFFEAQPRV